MSDKYILLPDKSVRPVDDLLEWAAWFEAADRVVAKTQVDRHVEVSTIFLGVNHSLFSEGSPRIFETAVITPSDNQIVERYATYEEAVLGHGRYVIAAREAVEEAKRSSSGFLKRIFGK